MLGGGGTGTTPRSRIGRLNADGSLDATFNPGANDTVTAVAVQPDGKVLVGGSFTTLGGGGTGLTTRNRIGRLNSDGSLDTTFNPGADNVVGALAVQPDGKILIGGLFTMLGGGGTGTTPRSQIGRLNADGSLDATFNPGANGVVAAVALQTGWEDPGRRRLHDARRRDGHDARNYIGRLNPDGSLDATFDPGANTTVHAMAVQPNGQILVSGIFTTLGGGGTGTTTRNRIGRLTTSGSLDTTFNPGANDLVATLAVRPDGRILVGGSFTMLGGGNGATARESLGQLHADGSLEVDFETGANYGTPCCTGGEAVYALAVQPDGKILVGGAFTELGNAAGSVARRRLGRLHLDGTVDSTFITIANSDVHALAVQPDGKILVGGGFTALGNETTGLTSRNRIGRLNSDGTVDLTFDPGANGEVLTLVIQPNGQILVGGGFDFLGGGGSGTTTRNRIGRLNPDGSIDATFNPGANGPVRAIAVQPDGRIVVGGNFTTLGGGGTGTPRATTSAGSSPMARSTRASTQARTGASGPWSCSPTGRSSSAGASTSWAVAGSARQDVASSDGCSPTALSTPPSTRAQTARSRPSPSRLMDRSWSAATSRCWAAAEPARRNVASSGVSAPQAGSIRPSIRKRMPTSSPSSCRRMGESWSAGNSRRLVQPNRRPVIGLADSPTPRPRSRPLT